VKPLRIKKFFNVARTVIAVSKDIKQNYDKMFGIECHVVPPLVLFAYSNLLSIDARQKYGIPQDAFVIAMIGSLKPMKNPQTILESLTHFSDEEFKFMKPHIVFAGDGILRKELESFVSEQGYTNVVTFLGNVPKELICEVMSFIDCYLIASDFEGTSVSVLEAMFNRKPIIYANSPGLVDMLEDGVSGMAFPCKDAEALKNDLVYLFKQPSTAQRLANTAYELYQQRYDYSQMLTFYLESFV
jgi:glycosyltransferase involved in cell wall biosynthesis